MPTLKDVYKQRLTAALSTPAPLPSMGDSAVALALAAHCGVTLSTPEAVLAVRRLVASIRGRFYRGTLAPYDSVLLDAYLVERCSEITPLGVGRYFAAVGIAASESIAQVPLNREGTLLLDSVVDTDFDVALSSEPGDTLIDAEAMAWHWVNRALLALAYPLVAILQDIRCTCGEDSAEEE